MKINIYYGGRGLVDDPTLSVLSRMQSVFEDLHVTVERFNLFEVKNSITTLPQTLKACDGVILASSVEWFGVGGLMHEFLDACWLYADKAKIAQTYMFPVVMSTTFGEEEGRQTLVKAWQRLGGKVQEGISGYVQDTQSFETNSKYMSYIEKKSENIYRCINQKAVCLPSSDQVIGANLGASKVIDLTPQESEQLSKYVADDLYVQTQKEDLKELSSLFKDVLGYQEKDMEEPYLDALQKAFHPQAGVRAVYKFLIEGRSLPLIVGVDGPNLQIQYALADTCDVEITVSDDIMDEICCGRKTFQRSFMAGEMKMKGDFKLLRALDNLFVFEF